MSNNQACCHRLNAHIQYTSDIEKYCGSITSSDRTPYFEPGFIYRFNNSYMESLQIDFDVIYHNQVF